jgi:anti-sigma regulatory factor (Ser/Thr protein kinase)
VAFGRTACCRRLRLPPGGAGHAVIVTAVTGGGTGCRLVLSRPADPAQLRPIRRRVARWAAENAVPADAVIDLQLVLGEAVSNGVEHAYRDGVHGMVEIELELRLAGGEPVVAVRVVDHGTWRPIPVLKAGRGRGLSIIDRLSRGLRIDVSDAGTQLTCAVPVRG